VPKKTAEDDKRQDQAQQHREILSNAYAFVEGQKATKSFAAITPEDLYDRFIERVEGADTQARPNVLNRITRTKNELSSAVAALRVLPAEAYRTPNPSTDVNTPVEVVDVDVSDAELLAALQKTTEG